jgi:hypothetical protein
VTTHAQYRAVPERRTLVNTVLNAAIVGAVSTSVLRWNAAAVVNDGLGGWPAAAWVTETNDANLGTVLKVLRRGVYHAALGLTLQTGNNTAAGISFEAPNATLLNTAVPINTTPGIVQGAEQLVPVHASWRSTRRHDDRFGRGGGGSHARHRSLPRDGRRRGGVAAGIIPRPRAIDSPTSGT